MGDSLGSILQRFAVIDQETAKGMGPLYVGVVFPNHQVLTFNCRDHTISIHPSMDPVYAFIQASEGTAALCLEDNAGVPVAGLVA